MFFYLPKLTVFFSEIGNNKNARAGQKKNTFFFGNARPKSKVHNWRIPRDFGVSRNI